MKKIDLHVHTNKSDGTFSPEEVVDYAHSIGLAAIGITDHDTVAGIGPAIEQAKKYDIEIVPGIEISAEWTEEKQELEIHMLGYFINWQSQDFQKKLDDLSVARVKRAEKIIEKLKQYGISLDMEDVQEFAPSTESIGRLHIAQAMVKEGCVSSINRAFDQYIGNNKPCYVSKYQLNPEGAAQIIKEIGGIAVIAHPGLLNLDFVDNLIHRLVKNGLDGIEVYYPEHRNNVITHLKEIAKEYNLLVTGGTDCHGLAKERILMGTLDIPYELLEKMKQRIEGVRS
ncbi:hypothetical protein AUJ66_00935 [Candidatus Desantisbacteria bacterium CG1_02_38_46]|uniref:Phosphatase n=3 Tax=unclassified Candidatus Desantisiibacteriota TaxID=3106372 RepID=A0A2H9PB53_9BACT|nr:MAG: hypothetical protein AUJ66_00935 [Candidatus Desantisbacteria bacterium CG1_02_38_46]PIU51485.1 MAG: phosphatase [Candidatus Desantisbacteria bacterium CG07_land_8_20_14_0_80_39_15]PIZ15909.1 MAG: phosphatase [Candidatus Desantisbacteria bacterium CG_4_10_14_0_8_um_filter_39_17]